VANYGGLVKRSNPEEASACLNTVPGEDSNRGSPSASGGFSGEAEAEAEVEDSKSLS
jgi:hypothetical protein